MLEKYDILEVKQCHTCGELYPYLLDDYPGFKCLECREKSLGDKVDVKPDFVSGTAHRDIILERDNFTCAYCHRRNTEDISLLHVDHIVPRSKGGEDKAYNLITSCRECNIAKSDTLYHQDRIDDLYQAVRDRNKESKIDPMLTIKENLKDPYDAT